MPNERSIYLFKGGNGDSGERILYRYDCAADTLEDTGARVPGSLVNQQVATDENDPRVLDGYKVQTDLGEPLSPRGRRRFLLQP